MAAKVKRETCVGCGACASVCPVKAVIVESDKAQIINKCIECGACVVVCPTDAITI
mgnify:CR=1 FL=1